MSDITPEKVADALSGGDDINEVLNGWVDVSAVGPVASIKFTPVKATDRGSDPDEDNARHFRAVVVEGETAPIVLERPASLEQTWGPGDEVRSWVSPDLFVVVNTMKTTNVGFLTPVQARRLAARLAALADEAQKLAGEEIKQRRAEAAQADQSGGAL